MKRLLCSLDGLPLPLKALSAYSMMSAIALALLGSASVLAGDRETTTSWGKTDEIWLMPAAALALFLAARLMTWPDRRAWFLLVAGGLGSLVAALVLGNSASAGATVLLVILALPSSREFYGPVSVPDGA